VPQTRSGPFGEQIRQLRLSAMEKRDVGPAGSRVISPTPLIIHQLSYYLQLNSEIINKETINTKEISTRINTARLEVLC
jgi:hypothetical protein